MQPFDRVGCPCRTGGARPEDHRLRAGRRYAPTGRDWTAATEDWLSLRSDEVLFDEEIEIDGSRVSPFVTWGTNPAQGVPLDGVVPDPASMKDEGSASPLRKPLFTWISGLARPCARSRSTQSSSGRAQTAGSRICDWQPASFAASAWQRASNCSSYPDPWTSSVRPRTRAGRGVHCCRGSVAQCRLLDVRGDESGPWCPGVPYGVHLNRNFEGRQGPGVRTHLASPAVAAASAVAGHLASPADLNAGHSRATQS